MFLRMNGARAFLCITLALQIATARNVHTVRRRDGSDEPFAITVPVVQRQLDTQPTAITDKTNFETTFPSTTQEPTATEEYVASTTSEETFTSATRTLAITTNGALDNSAFINVTIPEGQLPLIPLITPGWGVAGAVLLITGLVYTLIGIKNRWIHTFFSTAYISALGIAVLIVYVMNVPVSNALQGGYVVAVIVSGCAMGAGSIFFKELTEGLGCALGGFCVSMWLLCLAPGGLLRAVPSKAIFMSCFTLVGFAFYFSRYTRDWALIGFISFSGATVVVLGIDCFSRAGLKEFWAYIWELNENLFPLGANTYPITKGIRVETAAIIIIFLIGIMSQIKLWKIVREKRERRAAERAEGQRNLEQEEAEIGRQIEEANARDRGQWERAYGNGGVDSDVPSDLGTEKRLRGSFSDSAKLQTEAEAYEMTDITESDRAEPLEKDEEGKVIVRVAADDIPEASCDEGEATVVSSNTSVQRLQMASIIRAPEVVPLPFTVPEEDEDDIKSQGERSSVATFADEDGQPEESSRRHSLAKRLSQSSKELLRSLSPRSPRSPYMMSEPSHEPRESAEELFVRRAEREDDESSMAATFDGESVHGSERHSVLDAGKSPSIEITAVFSGVEPTKQEPIDTNKLAVQSETEAKKPRPISADTISTTVPGTQDTINTAAEAGNITSPATQSFGEDAEMSQRDQLDKAKSVASVISTPASLTADRLPRPLSRVAMSYRTNEWAKHLSYADAPELDELQIEQVPKSTRKNSIKSTKERAVPVNVKELQQRSDEGTPVPAIVRLDSKASVGSLNQVIRSDSRGSVGSLNQVVKKRGSRQSIAAPDTVSPENERRETGPPSAPMNAGINRSTSAMGLMRPPSIFAPIAEENDPTLDPAPIPEEQNDGRRVSASPQSSITRQSSVSGLVSYASPHTLLGQREIFMRNKSEGNLLSTLHPENNQYFPPERNYSTPEPNCLLPQAPPSEAGSLHHYPIYASALSADPDDVPLSQRRDMMRSSSMLSLSADSGLQRSSTVSLIDSTPLNSHQPQRNSSVPHPAVREAQLAAFRHSVAMDLTHGSNMISPQTRETPFSATGLLMGGRESEIKRNIELQRNMLLVQKEQEQQRKDMTRLEKEMADKAFNERMRSGDLMDAHREAMRKMQQNAREH